MAAHRVLVTCPPMLGMIEAFEAQARELELELVAAKVTQTLSEAELIELLPQFDGWIIGDDPATQQVFEAAQQGSLKAAVKWGIGVDNVDFKACEALGIPIINTPGMFGGEVADVAVGYVIALARHTVEIDRGVREGNWPKPRGLSLAGRTVAVVGYGDIGRNTARRLMAADMTVIAYDPFVEDSSLEDGVSWRMARAARRGRFCGHKLRTHKVKSPPSRCRGVYSDEAWCALSECGPWACD